MHRKKKKNEKWGTVILLPKKRITAIKGSMRVKPKSRDADVFLGKKSKTNKTAWTGVNEPLRFERQPASLGSSDTNDRKHLCPLANKTLLSLNLTFRRNEQGHADVSLLECLHRKSTVKKNLSY